MSTDLLFEHFDTLATAPGGVARLRELILQLAMQGKLGTQNAADEPASMLLDRIRKEKERLVKEGNIKNEKSLDSVNETNIQYNIPRTWAWTHLGEIGQIIGGGTPRTTNLEYYAEHGIPWLTPADLYGHKNKYIGKGRRDISEAGLKESSAQLLPKGSILFSSRAPIGYVAIASNSLSTNQGFKSCIPYVFEMSEFIYYFFVSAAKEIDAKASGTTFKEVSGQEVKKILFPLPPLAEQHRIVKKVDRLMALCDDLEASQQQERAGCLKLGKASLAGLQNAESPEEFEQLWAQVCDAFELVLNCPENVEVLRQTILQLAVRGRLVKQDPEDEPAIRIVDRISPIDALSFEEGEIPYALPDRWLWVKLGMITQFIDYRGKTPNKVNSGIKLITAKNVRMGYLNEEPLEYITLEEYQTWMTRGFPEVGDLLFTTEAPMGNVAQLLTNEKIALAQRIIDLHPYVGIFSTYLMYTIMSPFLQSCIEEKSSGVTARGIKAAKLKLILIPLPPLGEQHRIVVKLDALMALCDQMEAWLKERADVQGRYANAMIKQVTAEAK